MIYSFNINKAILRSFYIIRVDAGNFFKKNKNNILLPDSKMGNPALFCRNRRAKLSIIELVLLYTIKFMITAFT